MWQNCDINTWKNKNNRYISAALFEVYKLCWVTWVDSCSAHCVIYGNLPKHGRRKCERIVCKDIDDIFTVSGQFKLYFSL